MGCRLTYEVKEVATLKLKHVWELLDIEWDTINEEVPSNAEVVLKWIRDYPSDPGMYLFRNDNDVINNGACLLNIQYYKPESSGSIARDLLNGIDTILPPRLCIGRNPVDDSPPGWWYGPIPEKNQ